MKIEENTPQRNKTFNQRGLPQVLLWDELSAVFILHFEALPSINITFNLMRQNGA
jgi:hypothetical protein